MNELQSRKIQILRGIAIIAVIFIHNTPGGIIQVWVRPFENFGVGLFLFLSGFLSTANRWNPRKRIKKVILPYILWTLIYVVIGNIKNLKGIPKQFVISLLLGTSAPMMYFVFVYIEFSLLIPIIDRMAKSKFKYVGFIISPVEIVIVRMLPILLNYNMNKYLSSIITISCLGWFTYFYLGYLIGNNLLLVDFGKMKLIVGIVCSLILQMIEGYWYYSLGIENCGTQIKLSSILSGVLISILAYTWIIYDKDIKNVLLCMIGDCSFGLFFSHIAIMRILAYIPGYTKFIVFPVKAIIVVFISLLMVIIGGKILGKRGYFLALYK